MPPQPPFSILGYIHPQNYAITERTGIDTVQALNDKGELHRSERTPLDMGSGSQ